MSSTDTRQSVRAIVYKDDALLVMKRNKDGEEFYSLVGGGIDPGENAEQALHREVLEEASIIIASPRLVATDVTDEFGEQFIYLASYVSGEPTLAPDAIERVLMERGRNFYEPMWLPLQDLPATRLLPERLKVCLLQYGSSWPNEPIALN
ncbi:MAG: mismatch repair protein MutT [Candidatus Saccharibacteria bacterium]|nr:mismatch repair protein MutT [Candidatus Saccharibacteria bacterium]